MKEAILTKTEDQVIRLKLMGYQQKEIADRICRSLDTIKVHFRNIYEKINVQNEIELYNWYAENILQINIRQMLQVVVLMLIISPSIFSRNNEIQRSFRSKTSRASVRTSRGLKRNDNDYNLLFN
jgi:DNA-binding CsgD family transcriptional regulator